jgi:hypothetical protein
MRLVLVVLALCAVAFALEAEKNAEAKAFSAVEAKVKADAKDTVLGDFEKALSEGEEAIRQIRTRARSLWQRRKACYQMPTFAQRDDCMKEWRKDVKRNKAQRNLIKALRRCAKRFAKNAERRQRCVKRVATAYLKLRPIRVKAQQDKKTVVKVSFVLPSPSRLRCLSVRSQEVKKAVADGQAGKKKSLRKDAGAAIRALYKRLADIRVMRTKCEKLESAKLYQECMVPVNQKLKDNSKARSLLKSLRKCARETTRSSRAKCVRKYEDLILNLVAPGTPQEVPQSVQDLDSVVVRTADQAAARIANLQAKFNACETGKCRRRVRLQLRKAQHRLDELKPRFGPRRKCLRQRQQMRIKEFRQRAKEHARLTRLHRRAARCDSDRCYAKVEKQQKVLEKFIYTRRAAFKVEWKKLSCPFIAPPSNFKPVRKTLEQIENSDVKSLRSMRQRLVELYAALDECENGVCRTRVRNDIKDLKQLIVLLQQVQTRTLRKKRSDHKGRARLHRRLTKLYLLAADCSTRRCRLRYRSQLRAIQRKLKSLDRDELGRRAGDEKRMNRYYRLLQKALKRCPRSSLGRQCRLMVVHAFRAGTELRQKALVQYLYTKAKKQAKRDTAKCNANAQCTKKIADKLGKRLAQLKIRMMRVDRRRALRLCEVSWPSPPLPSIAYRGGSLCS